MIQVYKKNPNRPPEEYDGYILDFNKYADLTKEERSQIAREKMMEYINRLDKERLKMGRSPLTEEEKAELLYTPEHLLD